MSNADEVVACEKCGTRNYADEPCPQCRRDKIKFEKPWFPSDDWTEYTGPPTSCACGKPATTDASWGLICDACRRDSHALEYAGHQAALWRDGFDKQEDALPFPDWAKSKGLQEMEQDVRIDKKLAAEAKRERHAEEGIDE